MTQLARIGEPSQVRVPLFSKNADPQQDSPILRKSISYASDLVARGQARQLAADITDGIQLLSRFALDSRGTPIIQAGFDTAWGIRQSGWAGPLTWQMRTQKSL